MHYRLHRLPSPWWACWAIQSGCAKQAADQPAASHTSGSVDPVKAGRGPHQRPRRRHGRCVVRIGGKTLAPETHAIVISATPTPQQQFAAEELFRHLQRLTGKRIPILNDDQADGRNAIVVGKCRTLDKLGVRIDGRSAGFSDVFKVRRRKKRSVVLEADLGDGIRITRRIELDRREPVVRIVSRLSNTDSVAHSVRVKVFPSFGVAGTRRASVRVKSADGRRRPLRYQGTARLGVWLRDEQMPAGEWELVDETDTENIRVINRFRPGQISECYIYWSAPARRVYLQMYSPEVELAPGESTAVEHSYEVLRTAHPAPK